MRKVTDLRWQGLQMVLVASLLCAPVQAQEPAALSVSDAILLAVESSDALKAELFRFEAATEGRVQADNLRRPSIQLEANSAVTTRGLWAANGGLEWRTQEPGFVGLAVTQPVFQGGRIEAAAREADLRTAQAAARVVGLQNELVRDVIVAYTNVFRAREIAQIQDETVELLLRNLESTNVRRRAGQVGLTEVSQVEARLAAARVAAANARAELRGNWAVLERLIGTPPSTLDEIAVSDILLPRGLEEAQVLAIQASAELRVARLNEDIALANGQSVAAQMAPRVTVQASISASSDPGFVNGARALDAQIGARIIVPLWSGGQNASQVRAAQAEANAARFEALSLERRIIAEVTQAWATYVSSKAALDLTAQLEQAAETARRGANLEFEVGLRTVLDVLNQDQEWQNARITRVNSQASLMISIANLAFLVGLDPTGTVADPNSNARLQPGVPRDQFRAGTIAPWERPLVNIVDRVAEADRVLRRSTAVVRMQVFGNEN